MKTEGKVYQNCSDNTTQVIFQDCDDGNVSDGDVIVPVSIGGLCGVSVITVFAFLGALEGYREGGVT